MKTLIATLCFIGFVSNASAQLQVYTPGSDLELPHTSFTQSFACDQNADGLCTPADFSSWIIVYNAGC